MNRCRPARCSFLPLAAALGVLALPLRGLMAAEPTLPARPNVLLCLADDWGWPHAGAYGDQVVRTPTFDRLAEEGALFTHAFVSSPSCTPCRNALLTGQQFYRLAAGANLWSTLNVTDPNFVFLLREAGYDVAHWRKAWGPGDYRRGGYTEDPCGPKRDFASFMEHRDGSKPFFFWFGTSDPHRPYIKGSGAGSGMEVADISLPAFYPDQDEIRGDIADYYLEVQRWDSDVGAAVKLLEEAGLLDNTVIVMSGDHGMPFPRCKGNLYDRGTRVPLAIRWGDRVKPDRTVTDFVSFTDLAPTFLEVAGVDVPKEMTGHSLLSVLTDGGNGRIDATRNFIVFGRERHTPAQRKPSTQGYPSRAIRTDTWLLILNLEPDRWPAGVPEGATHPMGRFADCDDGPTKSVIMKMEQDPRNREFYQLCFAKRGPVELYDCEKDPDQVHDLAGDPGYAGVVETLRAQLVDYLKATGDPRFTDEPVRFNDYPYR